LAWVHVLVLATSLAGQAPSQAGPPAPEKKSAAAQTDKKPTAADKKPAAAAEKDKEKSARSPTTAATSGPHVRTPAEMQKPRSEFLVPPSFRGGPTDRYSPDIPDWNEIPPWRQTAFFGIRAQGQFFVYVIDGSGSMIDEDRMPRATIELRRSVFALRPPQKFEVIFYNEEATPMPGGPTPRVADQQAKSQLASWLRLMGPDGGTEPMAAIRMAMSLRPDAIFLLSDGAFPDGTVEKITRLNRRRIPIHTVDITGGLAGDHLKRIAKANGGEYASRPGDLQGKP
jgi:Mg-chelatase subunit ChlD